MFGVSKSYPIKRQQKKLNVKTFKGHKTEKWFLDKKNLLIVYKIIIFTEFFRINFFVHQKYWKSFQSF